MQNQSILTEPADAVESDPSGRLRAWSETGLSIRAARALTIAACDDVEDIRRIGRAWFADHNNCGDKTMREIETFIGGWPVNDATPDRIILSLLPRSISPTHAIKIAVDIVDGLTRHGLLAQGSR